MTANLSVASLSRKLSSPLVARFAVRPQTSHIRRRTLVPINFAFASVRTMASERDNEYTESRHDNNGNELLYVHIEDVEPLERYRLGGYHPVCIGDWYCDRYRVVHKLGFGTFSTTWLARDEKTATNVAIKISVSDPASHNESRIIRLLWQSANNSETHPGRICIPPLLDEFEIQGPNGLHTCLVTAPASMSIAETREASYKRMFQLPIARAIAAQLIQAVAFLHSRGVIHGDLHEGNVLIRSPRTIDHLTPEKLHDRYDQPELIPIERLDGQSFDERVPSHGVIPIWLGCSMEDVTVANAVILLTDFGESFQPLTSPRYISHTPLLLRAPEQYFAPSIPLSFPADIWALACAVFAIMGQRQLFDTWFPSPEKLMDEQVDTLGRPPIAWWDGWKGRTSVFDDELVRADGQARRPLESRFEYAIQGPRRGLSWPTLDGSEEVALCSLLKSMLAFEPEARPSAQEVLDSEWMTKWAKKDMQSARVAFLQQDG